MDWTTIVTSLVAALIPSGLVGTLIFFKENKRSRQLDNESKVIEEWKGITEVYKTRCAELKATVDSKNAKIEELYREGATMRERLDKLSSKNAVLEIFKCKEISCGNRKPPLSNSRVVANIVETVE